MFKSKLIVLFLLFPFILFSQESDVVNRMKKNIEYFSSDKLLGRKAGSEGEKLASQHLYSQLLDMGLIMLTPDTGQDFALNLGKDTLWSQNILGIVEGYDPVLKNEYIIVGANIDNIGSNPVNVNGDILNQVFPGADDNASGLASLIELAGMISQTSFMFKRTIIFVGFGASKQGLAGSWYYINKDFGYPDKISLMVDISSIGRIAQGNAFCYYVPDVNAEVFSLVDDVSKEGGFIYPKRGQFVAPSSDYLAFYEKGIPSILLTTIGHRDIGTVRDNSEFIDYDNMESACGFIYNFLRRVSDMEQLVSRSSDEIIDIKTSEEGLYNKNQVDRAPEFYHGDESVFLNRWVYTYIKYPEISINQGVQGRVIVDFIIEKDGSLSNIEIRKGLDDYIDDEVLKVLSVSPKWKPALLNGEKVRVKLSIPIEFKLKRR